MACGITADGPCTITPDALPAVVKTYNAALGYIIPSSVVGGSGTVDIYWDVDPLITDQIIVMLFRLEDQVGFAEPRVWEDQLTGQIAPVNTYTPDLTAIFLLRRETDTEFGPWHNFIAVGSPGWTPDLVTVVHGAKIVEYGTNVVLFDP